MIADACFSEEWQTRKREELGGCDPVLLEKTIHAFALLDALAAGGLDFVFKGGTSLLLRLPRIRRLSIDADIFCQEPPEKLDRLLAEVSRMRPFSGMTEDERGDHRVPARRHFKFSYTPLDSRNPAPFVLLDVVHERNLYCTSNECRCGRRLWKAMAHCSSQRLRVFLATNSQPSPQTPMAWPRPNWRPGLSTR
jgi:nucleotidyltransferase AbiEii toxin of type IV toxin-antitoxin system